MLKLRIPDIHKESIKKFSSFTQEKRQKIVEIAKSEDSIGLSAEQFSNLLTKRIDENDEFDLLSELFYALNKTYIDLSKTKEQFVDQVLYSVETDEFKVKESTKEYLLDILDSSITKTVTANESFLHNEKVYLNSRIITDVRPVFDIKNKMDLNGYISYNKITFEFKDEKDQANTITISIGNEQMKKLKEKIVEAEENRQKIESLQFGSLKNIKLISDSERN